MREQMKNRGKQQRESGHWVKLPGDLHRGLINFGDWIKSELGLSSQDKMPNIAAENIHPSTTANIRKSCSLLPVKAQVPDQSAWMIVIL